MSHSNLFESFEKRLLFAAGVAPPPPAGPVAVPPSAPVVIAQPPVVVTHPSAPPPPPVVPPPVAPPSVAPAPGTTDTAQELIATTTTLTLDTPSARADELVLMRVLVSGALRWQPYLRVQLENEQGEAVGAKTFVDDQGRATIAVAGLSVGVHRLRAVFTDDLASDLRHASSTSETVDLTVSPAVLTQQPTVTGKAVANHNSNRYPATVTLFLAEPGKPIPTGRVLITGHHGGARWYDIDTMGRVVVEGFNPGFPFGSAGVGWAYSGDANYAATVGQKGFSLQYPNSTGTSALELVAIPSPIHGEGVRLIATVSKVSGRYQPRAPMTGIVEIRYGGHDVIAHGYLDADGSFVVDLPAKVEHPEWLEARYAGDLNYRPAVASLTPFPEDAVEYLRDTDGDGWANEVHYHPATRRVWVSSDFEGVPQAHAALPVPAVGWRLAGVADFDGDRKADLLWTNDSTRKQAIWRQDRSMILGVTMLNHAPRNSAWVLDEVKDIDNDGDADLLWRNVTTDARFAWLLQGTAVVGGRTL